jgi:hypothetical protein
LAVFSPLSSSGFGPEEAGTRPWNIFSYTTREWEQQYGVEVLCLDQKQQQQELRPQQHESLQQLQQESLLPPSSIAADTAGRHLSFGTSPP